MEGYVDLLAPIGILGLEGMQALYKGLGQPVPTGEEQYKRLVEVGTRLLNVLKEIQATDIVGEPSASNNLATYVAAEVMRVGELLQHLERDWKPGGSRQADLVAAASHVGDFREMIDLARQYCEAQHEALLNKLSRAYQKPDFCIRRDSVGAGSDNLLPLALSWDEDWYYGRKIEMRSQDAGE